MLRCITQAHLTLLLLSALTLSSLSAAEPNSVRGIAAGGLGKEGKDYVSLGLVFNEFRSIDLVLEDAGGTVRGPVLFPLTAQTYGYSLTWGTYINDYFKTELRAGGGLRDDTVRRAMDINMSYWLAWYMGFSHPITDYMSGYAQYGVSHYEADITRREVVIQESDQGVISSHTVHPSRRFMEEGLFGTSFSTTWLLGLDFTLTRNWYLAFEYGRLLRDTESNIKVYQAGTHLRYEF